ncbi:hypothetical protein MMC27_007727 [Xylographa pallens]|nr:hypothetical protein [Xylographa pallens]
MGEYTVQYRDFDLTSWYQGWTVICSMSSAGFLDPIVGILHYRGDQVELTPHSCLPADAMWNLAMAINVYLTVFKKYNAEQLKSMEWIYLLVCYGGPLIPALAYCFISTGNGKIYGDATLWCWVSGPWDWLRVALCYAPAWFCIVTTFTIYLLAGRDIFLKRQQLRSFHPSAAPIPLSNPFTSWKTTEVHVTSELATMETPSTIHLSKELDPQSRVLSRQGFEQYSVTIGRGPERPKSDLPPGLQMTTHVQRNVALEANAAAWGYTRCALLFFVSLLITWVPSSLFRVSSLAHPGPPSWPLAFAAALVLPLMGFWNAVIYTATSWRAVPRLLPLGRPAPQQPPPPSLVADDARHRRRSHASVSDSLKALAEGV